MKKRFLLDWISILLIFAFSLNSIIHIFLYIEDQSVFNLISLILYPSCLAVYVLTLVIFKVHNNKVYLIIYNNFFEIYGKSVLAAKLLHERKNKKYLKYGLICTHEKIYEFSYNDLIVHFGLFEIDGNRKLMIVYKIKNIKEDFYEEFWKSIEKANKHYYENNYISILEGDNIFYKNKRNAFQIKEVDGQFIVMEYRHYIPIEIHSIKYLSECKDRWEYIGDSLENGLQYFETYEKAKEYIMSLNY